METQFHFLSPVEVVKVTSQNLEEVAAWCGGSVAETASRRVEGRMDKYVWVPTPNESNISWAFPGMFVTRRIVITVKGEFKETWAVFRKDYFEKNYFDSPTSAVDETWEKFYKQQGQKSPKPAVEEEPTQNITINIYESKLGHTDEEIGARQLAMAQAVADSLNKTKVTP